jgi:hypothetical protein
VRVSELDRVARFADFGRDVWQEKRRWLYRCFKRRRRGITRNTAAHLAKMLHALGVTEIYIGYRKTSGTISPPRATALGPTGWKWKRSQGPLKTTASRFTQCRRMGRRRCAQGTAAK